MLPGTELTLGHVLEILKRRIWLIVLPPAVTLFCALVYSATIPNLYQSDMLIAIVPQRVPDSFVRTTVTLRTDERLDALTVQVTSRTLLEQLIDELGLYAKERERLPLEDVIEQMRRSIQVELERPRRGPRGPEPPSAFHVRFTYTDPRVAAVVTQRLGSIFADQNAKDRGAMAEATNEFLESQLAEARVRLEAQERKVEQFRERHGTSLPTQLQSNIQVIQSTQMQIQALVESTARDRDRKLMLERLYNEARNEPALVAPVQPQQVASGTAAAVPVQQQLATARANVAALELRLRPEHPDIIRARRLIQELEKKAVAEPANAAPAEAAAATSPEEAQRRERIRQMRAEIESLDRQVQFKETEEQRLRGVAAEYQRRIEAVPGVESEWAALTRDYDTQQAAYRELLNKSEASKLAVDLEKRQIGEQFRVVDPAGVPVRPISPVRLQINGIGFAIGLLFGFGLAAFLEMRDASYRTDADVVRLLALPVLASVPFVMTAAERLAQSRRRLVFSAAAGIAMMGTGYVFYSMKLWNYLV